jgi:hypothetical protein
MRLIISSESHKIVQIIRPKNPTPYIKMPIQCQVQSKELPHQGALMD